MIIGCSCIHNLLCLARHGPPVGGLVDRAPLILVGFLAAQKIKFPCPLAYRLLNGMREQKFAGAEIREIGIKTAKVVAGPVPTEEPIVGRNDPSLQLQHVKAEGARCLQTITGHSMKALDGWVC